MPHPGDPRVVHVGVRGALGQHLREGPICVGAKHHSLLLVIQRQAAVEQAGALLTPVTTPIAAVGTSEAIEAREDVKGVGSGHETLLTCGACWRYRPRISAELIAVPTSACLVASVKAFSRSAS